MSPFPWTHVLRLHKECSLGKTLDAGTGEVSLQALLNIGARNVTAVTACQRQLTRLEESFSRRFGTDHRILRGLWSDPTLLRGETYDTILVHHLVGAIECFEPNFTHCIFQRFRALAKHRIFVIGFEPLFTGDSLLVDFARRLFAFRDCCQLLANQRSYREYSADWVVSRLQEANFRVVARESGPATLESPFLQRLSSVATQLSSEMPNGGVAKAMKALGEDLRQEGLELLDINSGKIVYGEEYLIVAEVEHNKD